MWQSAGGKLPHSSPGFPEMALHRGHESPRRPRGKPSQGALAQETQRAPGVAPTPAMLCKHSPEAHVPLQTHVLGQAVANRSGGAPPRKGGIANSPCAKLEAGLARCSSCSSGATATMGASIFMRGRVLTVARSPRTCCSNFPQSDRGVHGCHRRSSAPGLREDCQKLFTPALVLSIVDNGASKHPSKSDGVCVITPVQLYGSGEKYKGSKAANSQP